MPVSWLYSLPKDLVVCRFGEIFQRNWQNNVFQVLCGVSEICLLEDDVELVEMMIPAMQLITGVRI
jgi:hypothetical protein